VTVLDYGAKDSIARLLAEAGADVTVVPHDSTAADVAATDPDGVLLANGPGDPGVMDVHVANVRAMLDADRPLFGICLGHQLLARALGLETFKLRFGHRGANHPVLEQATGRVLVTSQNHGFAVAAPDGDDADVVVTHVSLYDGTIEGLRVSDRPVWSMQFHPEASPGPHDARDALVRFVDIAAQHAKEHR
jgi:carbamoyl-phosphate synthase small subunit